MSLKTPHFVFFFILIITTACLAADNLWHPATATEYMGGLTKFSAEKAPLYLLLAGTAFFSFLVVLISPTVGIILAMVMFPFVTQSGAMTVPKLLASVVLGGFFIAWFAGKIASSKGRKIEKDYFGAERAFLLFAIYLIINSVYAMFRGIPPLDIVRDLIPIFSLVIFLVAKRFVKSAQNIGLLEKFQFVLMTIFSLQFTLAIFAHLWQVYTYLPATGGALEMIALFIISMLGLIYMTGSKWLFLVTGGITGLFLISTDNRTQFIAAILGLILALTVTKLTRAKVVFVFTCIILFILAFIAVQQFAPKALEQKTAKLNEIKDAQSDLSIMDRIGEAKQCFELFKQNPVIGMGAGYTYRLYRQSMAGFFYKDYWTTNFTHSDFMFLLSKLGLTGLLLFLWFYSRLMKLAWSVWKKAQTPDSRARGIMCFIVLLTALIIGQSTPVLQTRSDAFFLSLIMAYTYCLYRFHVAEPTQERKAVIAEERERGAIPEYGFGDFRMFHR
jgi:O-antigen ligase